MRRLNLTLLACAGAGLVLPATAAAACRAPAVPTLSAPDGTERARHRVGRHVYRYLVRMERYSACMQTRYAREAKRGATAETLAALVTAHNDSVARSRALVSDYEADFVPVAELMARHAPRRFPAARYEGFAAPPPEQVGPNGPAPQPGTDSWNPAGFAAFVY